MTKEVLLSKFNELRFENFLQELRFQVDNYLKKQQNENVAAIKKEVANLITTEGQMAEDVDYRRMSYTEYERKVEALKVTAKKLVESLPDDFSDVINSKDESDKKKSELKTEQVKNKNEFTEVEAEMTVEEKKQVRAKFVSTSTIWGLLASVSLLLILLLPRYLKDIAQLAIVVFIISAPVFLIYFSMNYKLLKADTKRVITGTLRKYSRLSETRKNRHLKYFFSVGKHEFMVTIFEYNKLEDNDLVEMHICKSNNKILSVKKLNK